MDNEGGNSDGDSFPETVAAATWNRTRRNDAAIFACHLEIIRSYCHVCFHLWIIMINLTRYFQAL